jgi:hypothetical protein
MARVPGMRIAVANAGVSAPTPTGAFATGSAIAQRARACTHQGRLAGHRSARTDHRVGGVDQGARVDRCWRHNAIAQLEPGERCALLVCRTRATQTTSSCKQVALSASASLHLYPAAIPGLHTFA